MQYIKPFLLESREVSNPFFEMFTAELDALGVEWQDRATARQSINGTHVITIRKADAVQIVLNNDWDAWADSPRLKNRIIKAKSKSANLIRKDEKFFSAALNLFKEVPLDPATDSLGAPSFIRFGGFTSTIVLYIYKNSVRGDHAGSPSSGVTAKFNPSSLADVQLAIAKVLSGRIISDALGFLENLDFYTSYLLTSSLDWASRKSIEDFIDAAGGAQSISVQIENFAKDPTQFWGKVNLSQEYFNKLVRDNSISNKIKEAIYQNPNYFAPDDILSDWF